MPRRWAACSRGGESHGFPGVGFQPGAGADGRMGGGVEFANATGGFVVTLREVQDNVSEAGVNAIPLLVESDPNVALVGGAARCRGLCRDACRGVAAAA